MGVAVILGPPMRYLPEMRKQAEADVREALAWIGENPEAYVFMVRQAHRLARKGYVSANYLLDMARNELHVKVRPGLATAFARILSTNYPALAKSFRSSGKHVDRVL